MRGDKRKEQKHLDYCINIIKDNIKHYNEKIKRMKKNIKEIYDSYRSDNPELYNDLVVELSLENQAEQFLHKNETALKKAYFGRIDYVDRSVNESFSYYIGKNGIMQSDKDILIVDWRAPVSSIYYECNIGEGSYTVPHSENIDIVLKKKRTYEIDKTRLEAYYDTDIVTADKLLLKYLSQNKEEVLNEIVATIQKEQNDIIRMNPFCNVLVQGVAGSGKTTVAMHRISYILYNYKEFKEDKFFVIGSNRILLDYITRSLPDLEVQNVEHLTLYEFIILILEKEYLKNFSMLKDSCVKDSEFNRMKSSIAFVKKLEEYLLNYELQYIPNHDILYMKKVIMTKESIENFIRTDKNKISDKIDILNQKIVNKIQLYNELKGINKNRIKEEVKKYKHYFGDKKIRRPIVDIYKEFIQAENLSADIKYQKSFQALLKSIQDNEFDLYDFAFLLFIEFKIKRECNYELARHIVVDEAQDFGAGIFYILKKLLSNCTYTIMGDVAQNVNFNTGMNDWEELRKEVFYSKKDKFYVLAKSYRNTIEISNFAEAILKKCSFKNYKIETVIRHGEEVKKIKVDSEDKLMETLVMHICEIQEEGYPTIAIICLNEEQADMVREGLKKKVKFLHNEKNINEFGKNVMVLPILLTKGLEFDAVLLWNPDKESYPLNNKNGKLLYVAATRALHKLRIIYSGDLSELL